MMRIQTVDELQKRMANPLDHNANRVRALIGGIDLDAVDDWTKARAFEDLLAMAIQIAMHTDRTPAVEIAREVGMGMLTMARKAIDEPLANEPKGRTS